MEGEKQWWESKTFYGAVIMLVSVILNYFKVDLGGQEEWVNALSGLVGSVMAMIGRVKAVKKIK